MGAKWKKLLSREGVDLTTLFEVDKAFYGLFLEFTGKVDELLFTTLENKIFTHYMSVDIEKFGHFLYSKYLNNISKIKALIDKGNKALRLTKINANQWEQKIKRGGNKEIIILALQDLIDQFKEVNYYYSIMPFVPIEVRQQDFQTILEGIIKRNKIQDDSQFREIVCRPFKKTAIIELQDKLQQGESSNSLLKDYQFLRSWSLVWYVPLDKTWINSLKIRKEAEKQARAKIQILKSLKLNRIERQFIEIAPYVFYLKDWRDDLRRSQAYYWSFLFDVIAKYLNILRDDLGYLSLQEILIAVNAGAVDKNLIKQRKNLSVITSSTKKIAIKIITGEGIKKYKKIVAKLEAEKEKEIKGLIAQKGKVIGRVQLIQSAKDINRFKDGFVLVANSTHPNYLPAMHKSIAIVTNEGGIASHAAIVARELKIPCIVGTKIATKILKDGDLVEVDAEKGIVRKL
jgi:phosphohistidine swiveling domain-containing protein